MGATVEKGTVRDRAVGDVTPRSKVIAFGRRVSELGEFGNKIQVDVADGTVALF